MEPGPWVAGGLTVNRHETILDINDFAKANPSYKGRCLFYNYLRMTQVPEQTIQEIEDAVREIQKAESRANN